MKYAYPVILTPDNGGYVVYIPDFEINTEGDSLVEAIEMARDAIGLLGIIREDDGFKLPKPSDINRITKQVNSDIMTLVDVDFAKYREQDERLNSRSNRNKSTISRKFSQHKPSIIHRLFTRRRH